MPQLDNIALIMGTDKPDHAFFVALGARIAELRQAQGLTQAQLGDALGISQSTINTYEVGRRRIQVSALPRVAEALGVSVEDLIGAAPKSGKRGPAPKLQQQLERVSRLPRAEQRFVSKMLDVVLKQAS